MTTTEKRVYLATTVDTKGAEAVFMAKIIEAAGVPVVIVDLSTTSAADRGAGVKAKAVAQYHPEGSAAVFCGDRGKAIEAMAVAFQRYIAAQDDIAALLGIGGSGGTALITPAMQSLPIGTPKLMISTMASGDIAPYIGASDISMMYSVTDVAGINRISRKVLANGANMIAGAVRFQRDMPDILKPAIGLTMFGVTTPCIQGVTSALESEFDCLVFHATGSGGKAMEKLVDSQLLDGVLDLTTTEVCDHLFGGVLACDEGRLDAIARTQIPYIGSCGALDMVNFHRPDTVPAHYADRLFYHHNPQVTLMRTTVEENAEMGRWIGEKLNACDGSVRFLIPEGGVSVLDSPDMPFWAPDADHALFEAIEKTVQQTDRRKIVRVPYNINDERFIAIAVSEFQAIYAQKKATA